EVAVYRGTDHRVVEAGGGRDIGAGALSQAWPEHVDVLPLALEVRWHGNTRSAPLARTRGREPAAQAAGGGPSARCSTPEGSDIKKVVTPEAKRSVVGFWRAGHGISERRACRLLGLCRATQRYTRRPDRSAELRRRLRELAEQRRRFGYRRLHVLLEREGMAVNLKRVRRIYREEGLSLRQRRGRRRYRGVRVVLPL